MSRPKGSKNKLVLTKVDGPDVESLAAEGKVGEVILELEPLIHPLSVDYPNEWTNDIARKINEIIEILNEK